MAQAHILVGQPSEFQSRWVKETDLDSRHVDKAWERPKESIPAEFFMRNSPFQQFDWQSF
jgi:hypothetical protein